MYNEVARKTLVYLVFVRDLTTKKYSTILNHKYLKKDITDHTRRSRIRQEKKHDVRERLDQEGKVGSQRTARTDQRASSRGPVDVPFQVIRPHRDHVRGDMRHRRGAHECQLQQIRRQQDHSKNLLQQQFQGDRFDAKPSVDVRGEGGS